eukprot:TRINITY_DN1968_c0_g1_i1.p1 TRINITY_DN1968_c0_g1~~TRINITY_DN1968_c0_g1_i1.p1  ORF type:complete len:1593 (+),score=400.23 TRINITY_DN1968_c0_g1_i1:632-4780(+)
MAHQILKPLYVRPLPMPWQVHRRQHGRFDFYHPGMGEYRRKHPLFGFFGEIVEFLRMHASTDVPITEPLTAQVFKEISPQTLRERLGFWEGPLEDPTKPGGKVGGILFRRKWKGRDDVCTEGNKRRDDPRLEAAANLTVRISGWRHLWTGFAPEEPFPLLDGRLPALSQQLSESVVTAPGKATEQMIAHMEHKLPELEESEPEEEAPEPEPVEEPTPALTEEEEAVQPVVLTTLSKVYGVALSEIGRREIDAEIARGRLPRDTDSFAASIICLKIYALAKPRVDKLQHDDEMSQHYTDAEEEFEEESDGSYEEEQDALEEEPEEEEEAETSEEEVEEQGEVQVEEPEPVEEKEPDPQEEPAEDPIERELPIVAGFLRYKKVASEWAEDALRPLTPISGRKEPHVLTPPASPGKPPGMHRQRLDVTQGFWGQTIQTVLGTTTTSTRPPPPPDFVTARSAEPQAPTESNIEDSQAQGEESTLLSALDPDVSGVDGHTLLDGLEPPKEAENTEALEQEEEAAENAEAVQEGGRTEEQEEEDEYADDFAAETQEGFRPQSVDANATARSEGFTVEEVALSGEKQAKVNDFTQSLMAATSFFDDALGTFETSKNEELAMLGTAMWKRAKLENELPDAYSTGRGFLAKAHMPYCTSDGLMGEGDNYENVVPGAIARHPSPSRGSHPAPPYMQDAKPPPTGVNAGKRAWPVQKHERARSSEGRLQKDAPVTRRNRKPLNKPSKPKPVQVPARPHSASARSRLRRPQLDIYRPGVALNQAAQSTKRFLSRTCGTMQMALATFDPSGDGRFDRQEWADGLRQLGYESTEDIQDLFTAIDKRGHHMLTLSDLLDYCKGIPVSTGMPDPGLRGMSSELFHEVVSTEIKGIVSEALSELLEAEFVQPRGPASGLPDVDAHIKKLRERAEREKKEQERLRKHTRGNSASTSGRIDRSNSEDTSVTSSTARPTKSPKQKTKKPSSRPRTSSRDGSQVSDGRSQAEDDEYSDEIDSDAAEIEDNKRNKSPKSKSKASSKKSSSSGKAKDKASAKKSRSPSRQDQDKVSGKSTKKGGGGGRARTPDPDEISDIEVDGSSPSSAKPRGKSKSKAKKPTDAANASPPSSAKKKPEPHQVPKMLAKVGSATSQAKQEKPPPRPVIRIEEVGSQEEEANAAEAIQMQDNPKLRYDASRKKGQAPRGHQRDSKMKRSASATAGRFPGYGYVDEDGYDDRASHKLLPWVPRPTDEICKTYSHIFRLISDPRVKRLSHGSHKRNFQIAVPRMPAMGQESEEDAEEDVFDPQEQPLGRTLGAKGGKWMSKSSPNLTDATTNATSATGVSTTAGTTWRPGSGGSEKGSVTLPPLMAASATAPAKGRPWAATGAQAAGIDSGIRPGSN